MRAWAIKLGSGGVCVPFCEKHSIVGVGWHNVSATTLATADLASLRLHVGEVCRDAYGDDRRKISFASGQLYSFARVCAPGDFVIYYDPPKKHVRVARVTSDVAYRDFELSDRTDIWHYRKVELSPHAIPIVEFYGGLKGRLLGPRMSFWGLPDPDAVRVLFSGERVERATDPEIEAAYGALRDLLIRRAETLTADDWEWLVVDYFKAQGAHVDERRVGGSHAVIDLEARFDHGELGDQLWRVQVKRLRGPVDWPQIEEDWSHAGNDDFVFCYVSVSGFTPEARKREEEEEGLHLLEARDFVRFLLSGKLRPRLREKLRLPFGA